MRLNKNVLIILFLTFIFIAGVAVYGRTATLNFKWTPNTDSTTGYKIVRDGGTNVILDVSGKETDSATYTFADDAECHTFSIFAYNDTQESKLGNILYWCPAPDPVPGIPGQYLLTIEPVD